LFLFESPSSFRHLYIYTIRTITIHDHWRSTTQIKSSYNRNFSRGRLIPRQLHRGIPRPSVNNSPLSPSSAARRLYVDFFFTRLFRYFYYSAYFFVFSLYRLPSPRNRTTPVFSTVINHFRPSLASLNYTVCVCVYIYKPEDIVREIFEPPEKRTLANIRFHPPTITFAVNTLRITTIYQLIEHNLTTMLQTIFTFFFLVRECYYIIMRSVCAERISFIFNARVTNDLSDSRGKKYTMTL